MILREALVIVRSRSPRSETAAYHKFVKTTPKPRATKNKSGELVGPPPPPPPPPEDVAAAGATEVAEGGGIVVVMVEVDMV